MATKKPKKGFKIVLPEDNRYVQPLLWEGEKSDFDPYPPIKNTSAGIEEIIRGEGDVGLDLEYYQTKDGVWHPSIIGLSNDGCAAAVGWNVQIAKDLVDSCIKHNRRLVGHSVVGADKPVLDAALNIKTPITLWADSMLTHYLCNSDLSKSAFKADDEGSLGFMNLWTAASLTTMLPNWKSCAEAWCDQRVCPRHSVFNYCAVDSWAGLQIYKANTKMLQEFGVKDWVMPDMMELAEICHEMEEQGVAIDKGRVAELKKEMAAHKDNIFEWEMQGKEKVFKKFNPNSPAQVKEWFAKRNINLEKSDKKFIHRALEKEAKRLGYLEVSDLEETEVELPEVTRELLNLFEYKSGGKGPDPWFGGKYFRADGLIHPRFLLTGASSSRLASSKPNFQNIANKGWGKKLKECVVPRSEHLDFIECDSSQLELRVILYQAGADTSIASHIFEDLVEKSNGAFDKAAELMGTDARYVAKSVVHAADLLETIKIIKPHEMGSEYVRRNIKEGSLVVDENWWFGGGYVGFTGINLADRLFGSHTTENRRRALELRRYYLDLVPEIERWHKKSLNEIHERGFSQIPWSGRFLRLYGTPEENAKIGVALLMQGGGASYSQGVMLNFKRIHNKIPVIQVHDSVLFEVDRAWSDKKAYEFISLMFEEVDHIPGLRVPGKAQRGNNYGEMRPLTK